MRGLFFGQPSANFVEWCTKHYGQTEDPDPVDNTEWGQIVQALENCQASEFNTDTLAYTGSNTTLTAINYGCAVTDIKYKVYSANDAVDTTWINLGFNATIPEYVKYRRAVGTGWKHIWVKSLKSGLISPIAVGDAVYTRIYNETTLDNDYTASSEETVTSINGEFKYGNNYKTGDSAYDARYSVPTSITTAKGTYVFCGYSLTLNSQAIINVEGQNKCMWSGVRLSSGTNDWSQAKLRTWLNSTGTVDGMYFNGNTGYNGLLGRLTSNDGFMKNISKAINKTWVYVDYRSGKTLDSNFCEHISDRFWTMGNGNVNCTDTDYYGSILLYDNLYDSFRCKLFTEDKIFTQNPSRVKYLMNTSGASTATAGCWWLRSAYTSISDYAADVFSDGDTDSHTVYTDNDCGVAPACTIG